MSLTILSVSYTHLDVYKRQGMKIQFPVNLVADNKKVNFELFRTDDANLDVKKELHLDNQNSILIPEKVIKKGSYTLKVKWSQNKKPVSYTHLDVYKRQVLRTVLYICFLIG